MASCDTGGVKFEAFEKQLRAPEGSFKLADIDPRDTVGVGKSDVVEISLTNTIEKDEVPVEKGGDLASTGSAGLGIMGAAALALLLAGVATVLLAARRRRS